MLFATVRQRKIHVKRPETVIRNGKNVDELVLEMDDEWTKMDQIVGVFVLRYQVATEEEVENEDGEKETITVMKDREEAREVFVTVGEPVMVPWECLAETGLLSLSITGYVGGEQVMTTMMPDSFWTVVQNGPMDGDESIEPTPSLYDQIMAAAGRANTAAAAAETAEAELRQAKDSGEFDGVSPTVQVDGVVTGAAGSGANVENVGTEQDVKLRFTIPRGAQGKAGRGIKQMVIDSDFRVHVYYDDGSTQNLGQPNIEYMARLWPYVKGVKYADGKLTVTTETDPYIPETTEFEIPVFTDEDRDNLSNAVLDIQTDPNAGVMVLQRGTGFPWPVALFPSPATAEVGAFFRVNEDGFADWESLTDVSKEGA